MTGPQGDGDGEKTIQGRTERRPIWLDDVAKTTTPGVISRLRGDLSSVREVGLVRIQISLTATTMRETTSALSKDVARRSIMYSQVVFVMLARLFSIGPFLFIESLEIMGGSNVVLEIACAATADSSARLTRARARTRDVASASSSMRHLYNVKVSSCSVKV